MENEQDSQFGQNERQRLIRMENDLHYIKKAAAVYVWGIGISAVIALLVLIFK